MRILSYNIHKGFAPGNQKFILPKIKEAVHVVNPDIVFLQEVLGEHKGHRERFEEWPDETQFEYLADTLWPHHAYGKNAIYNSGHHGNAILSRFPFLKWDNIDISSSRFERRGLLHGVIQAPDSMLQVHVICIHLSLLEGARSRQIETLCRRLAKKNLQNVPVIIAGDFNDWAEVITPVLEREMGMIEVFKSHTGSHARTFPVWLPVFRLDRIYVRGFTVVESQCLTGLPWKRLSDHAALYTELQGNEERG